MPETLSFWKSETHTVRSIRDLEVHVFTDAIGPATLRFDTHAIFLLETKAKGSLLVNGEDHSREEYAPNSVFFVPKNTTVHVRTNEPMITAAVIIPERWFNRVLAMNSDLYDCNFVYFEVRPNMTLATAVALLKSISLETPRIALPPLIDALILSIVYRVLKVVCKTRENRQIQETEPIGELEVAQVDSYIDQNIDRSIKSNELAAMLGLSPSHFTRAFKAATGRTPLLYVLRRRVDTAKYYLATSKQSLAQIALLCGFASQSHFTTSFKEVTSITPAFYRKHVRRDTPLATLLWLLPLKLLAPTKAAQALAALAMLTVT
jgi:AraC family transcriptional regulator